MGARLNANFGFPRIAGRRGKQNALRVSLRPNYAGMCIHSSRTIGHDGGLCGFGKAKECLANLVVLPGSNTVMFADASNLYGIAFAAAQPAENFRGPIEFERRLGGGRLPFFKGRNSIVAYEP
jgi:hypothetical protein